ncbi:MAG: hypothetical protein ACRED5_16635 [Propylenella sp.]
MRLLRLGGVLPFAAVALPALAFVGTGHVLFGSASYELPGHDSNRAVRLVADVAGGNPFSGIDFGVSAGLTVNDLNSLSTDTFFPAGSSCKDGSPRFQIKVDHDGDSGTPSRNIFVYIGPPPNYTGCPAGAWDNTGNLIEAADLVDATQLGGAFYEPWATAQANFGALGVTGIQLVADEFSGPQTVIVDNTDINGTVHDYEFDNKDDCKKDGWMNFVFEPGPFKNQGQCVSYFAKQQ